MIPNDETVLRQTLVMAILHDIVLASIKSIGSVNTTDDNKLQIVVHEEICKSLNQ